jgi:hypothetical protein
MSNGTFTPVYLEDSTKEDGTTFGIFSPNLWSNICISVDETAGILKMVLVQSFNLK